MLWIVVSDRVVVRTVVYSADNGRQVGWWAAAAAGAAWRPPASMKADCPAYYCTTPLYTTHHTAYCTAPHCTQPSTQLSRLLHHCCHTVHTTTPLLLPHCTQLSTQPPHSTLVLAHCLHTALACTLLVDCQCHTAWACTLSLCLLFCTLSRVRSSNVLPQNIYNIQCGQ